MTTQSDQAIAATLCERKKRAHEAMAYNGQVQSWPEIARLARATASTAPPKTGDLFDADRA